MRVETVAIPENRAGQLDTGVTRWTDNSNEDKLYLFILRVYTTSRSGSDVNVLKHMCLGLSSPSFVRSFIHSFIRSFSVRFLPFSPMSRQQWRCADERCPLFSRPQSFAVLPAYGNPILLPFLRPFLLSVCLLSLSIHSYSYYFVLSLTVPGYSYSFFFISMSLFRYFVYSIIPRESMKRFHSIFAWEVSK